MPIRNILFPLPDVLTVPGLLPRVFGKTASATMASQRATHSAIDDYVAEQMRRLRIPGLSMAIVEGERVVHMRGFGRARPGGEAPDPQTPFVLGSTTKSFTALAIMQLVEAGKVELDAPVQRYLPWFRVADATASAAMTVRHLLNQTSGLPMLPGIINLADLDDDAGAAVRQARGLSRLKLAHPVGDAFEYSNLNYNLLGLIIETASGSTYADYVQRRIFAPLQMNHSHTSKDAARRDRLAVGHRYWFGHPIPAPDLPLPRGSLPSGQLISSAEDMSHYLIAHLNGGRFQEAQVLSRAGIEELHRGVAEQRVMGSPVAAYGMGWFVAEIDGTKVLSHSGNVPEFSSYMAILPERKRGVVLLANADHWGLPFVISEVGDGVAALLANREPTPIRFGFIPWTMRALPLVPLLQIAGVLATFRRLRRWRQEPSTRPARNRMWGRHVLLPLLSNLSFAAMLATLRSTGALRFLRLFTPDLAWTAKFCGTFALVWGIVRTGLLLGARRDRPPAHPRKAPGLKQYRHLSPFSAMD